MRFTMLITLMLSLFILSGCDSEPPSIVFADIDMSVADAGSGEKLYAQSNNGAPACITCHLLEEGAGVGPSLVGIASALGNRVDGQSAEEYLYWSILRPSEYLTAGYSNVMYAKYEEAYEAADIADLIAYLLTLE